MNQIGICTGACRSSLEYFAKTGRSYALPYVIYTINNETPECVYIKKPLEVFRRNMEQRDIDSIVRVKNETHQFLQLPGEAYKKMMQYLVNNTDKVIADMVASRVVKTLAELGKTSENVFFIDNPHNDKLVGRLSYLYLDNEINSFYFVTYNPQYLMTNVTNIFGDTLTFDINYFSDTDTELSEIYPNNMMESLMQTVFLQINSDKKLLPLRLDIFSQGLRDLKGKTELAVNILKNDNSLYVPSKSQSFVTRIPKVLFKSIEANEYHQKILEDILHDWEGK